MTEETFSVFQFFEDGSYEAVRNHVGPEEAALAAYQCCNNVAANCGMIRRVIITDSGGCTCFEWRYGEGVIFNGADARVVADEHCDLTTGGKR